MSSRNSFASDVHAVWRSGGPHAGLAYSERTHSGQVGDRRHVVYVLALPLIPDLDTQDAAACRVHQANVAIVDDDGLRAAAPDAFKDVRVEPSPRLLKPARLGPVLHPVLRLRYACTGGASEKSHLERG